MRGIVTNLRAVGNGYVEVAITESPIGTTTPNAPQMVATVQVAAGSEPKIGALVEVTLTIIG